MFCDQRCHQQHHAEEMQIGGEHMCQHGCPSRQEGNHLSPISRTTIRCMTLPMGETVLHIRERDTWGTVAHAWFSLPVSPSGIGPLLSQLCETALHLQQHL